MKCGLCGMCVFGLRGEVGRGGVVRERSRVGKMRLLVIDIGVLDWIGVEYFFGSGGEG